MKYKIIFYINQDDEDKKSAKGSNKEDSGDEKGSDNDSDSESEDKKKKKKKKVG